MDLPARSLRVIAVPVVLLDGHEQRGPCQACDYVAPAPVCLVMRARVTAMGLPDCAAGFIYREVMSCE